MESSLSNGQIFVMSWVCLSPLVIIGLIVLLFRQSKRVKTAQAESQNTKERLVRVEKDAQYALREAWFSKLGKLSFANEVEVEIKFVYPLLLYLGYQDDDFSVRYKVQMQAGREHLLKEADWIVWKRSGNDAKAVLVIEAKAPGQALDSSVQGQGRSYAFSVNARIYVLTNGSDFMVYERGIEYDRCSLQCNVGELAARWPELRALIGATDANNRGSVLSENVHNVGAVVISAEDPKKIKKKGLMKGFGALALLFLCAMLSQVMNSTERSSAITRQATPTMTAVTTRAESIAALESTVTTEAVMAVQTIALVASTPTVSQTETLATSTSFPSPTVTPEPTDGFTSQDSIGAANANDWKDYDNYQRTEVTKHFYDIWQKSTGNEVKISVQEMETCITEQVISPDTPPTMMILALSGKCVETQSYNLRQEKAMTTLRGLLVNGSVTASPPTSTQAAS